MIAKEGYNGWIYPNKDSVGSKHFKVQLGRQILEGELIVESKAALSSRITRRASAHDHSKNTSRFNLNGAMR